MPRRRFETLAGMVKCLDLHLQVCDAPPPYASVEYLVRGRILGYRCLGNDCGGSLYQAPISTADTLPRVLLDGFNHSRHDFPAFLLRERAAVEALPDAGSLTRAQWSQIEAYQVADLTNGLIAPEAHAFVQRLYDLGVPQAGMMSTPFPVPASARTFTFRWEGVELTVSSTEGGEYLLDPTYRGAKIRLSLSPLSLIHISEPTRH